MEDGEMKKRMLAVVMLTVMGLVVGLSGGVAQAAWATCTISNVGSTGSNYWVTATDTTVPTPLFTNVTFILDETNGRGKEMFATALTAFANSTNIQLWVDPPYNNYTTAWGALATK
jgi:hypothetical protein